MLSVIQRSNQTAQIYYVTGSTVFQFIGRLYSTDIYPLDPGLGLIHTSLYVKISKTGRIKGWFDGEL